ncbi:ABC transporter ATP-binding protein [Hyphobacterium sp.]|uniref:ABC transporter ATP-binding protein n=1 Tax=Hyphobacterium sp. TaxID=2004662 RepID=UPI003B529854
MNYPIYQRAVVADKADIATPAGDENGALTHRNSTLIRGANNSIVGVRALSGVSFDLESGGRLAIIGENGSGKTTLLQVLAEIYTPDAGEVVIEGRTTSVVNINLGMSLEASGHNNITLRGLAAGRSRREIEEHRADIVAFSELGEFLDLPVQTYSAGMRMRLNFAIATAFQPEILILDEWLSAGDAAFRKKATARMQSFVEQAGILILASHSRQLMEATCDRAIWLDHGVVRAEGDVKEIADAYDEEMMRRQKLRDARAQAELEMMRAQQEAEKEAEEKAESTEVQLAEGPSNIFARLLHRLLRLFRK